MHLPLLLALVFGAEQAPRPPQAPPVRDGRPSVEKIGRACDCRTAGPAACDCKFSGTACHGAGCGCHDDCTCLVGARPPLVVRGRKVVLPPRAAPAPVVVWEVTPATRPAYYAAPPVLLRGFGGGAAGCGPGG